MRCGQFVKHLLIHSSYKAIYHGSLIKPRNNTKKRFINLVIIGLSVFVSKDPASRIVYLVMGFLYSEAFSGSL